MKFKGLNAKNYFTERGTLKDSRQSQMNSLKRGSTDKRNNLTDMSSMDLQKGSEVPW